ncbi:MAG: DUF1801 domain-containing protein [Gallicola sp.]|nr:DUF1801 domain-containing protein [Gallicola sp.]
MAELKTKEHDGDVYEFIDSYVEKERKKNESYELVKIFEETTGHPAKMWGDSIIGFGKYHYKSERSRQEGDWMMVGFSPRKAAFSLYVYSDTPENKEYLESLGKYKMGKSCIYVNKLADIDLEILKKMILSTMEFLTERYDPMEKE